MATGIFVFRLRSLVEAAASENAADAPRVMCACLPNERHELGLLASGYSLAIRDASITMLGADVPFSDLEESCTLLAPTAALLSVSTTALHEAREGELLAFRKRLDPRIAVVLAGSGVPRQDPEFLRSAVMTVPLAGPPSETARSLLGLLGLPDSDLESSAG